MCRVTRLCAMPRRASSSEPSTPDRPAQTSAGGAGACLDRTQRGRKERGRRVAGRLASSRRETRHRRNRQSQRSRGHLRAASAVRTPVCLVPTARAVCVVRTRRVRCAAHCARTIHAASQLPGLAAVFGVLTLAADEVVVLLALQCVEGKRGAVHTAHVSLGIRAAPLVMQRSYQPAHLCAQSDHFGGNERPTCCGHGQRCAHARVRMRQWHEARTGLPQVGRNLSCAGLAVFVADVDQRPLQDEGERLALAARLELIQHLRHSTAAQHSSAAAPASASAPRHTHCATHRHTTHNGTMYCIVRTAAPRARGAATLRRGGTAPRA